MSKTNKKDRFKAKPNPPKTERAKANFLANGGKEPGKKR